MSNYKINIIEISHDRQQCIDSKSKIYNINDVIKNSKDMNVHVVTYKGIQYIRYKKNCKNSITRNIGYYTVHNKSFGNNGKIYNMHVIFEDANSANTIMIECIRKFAEVNNIRINCCIIKAKGVSNIANCIRKYAKDIKYCIVVYDDLTQDTDAKDAIENEIKFIRYNSNDKFILFKPRCIEECALSFKYLTDEISTSTSQHKIINKGVNNYFITGRDYMGYDPLTNQYILSSIPVTFGYYSKYLKENVTNMERLLADILAQITYNNPYEFIKKLNECWYKNCKTNTGYCVLANIIGTKRPNSKVARCSKLLLHEDKIKTVILNSLFAGFYDALQIIFGINTLITNPNTLKEVITCYI